MQMGLRVLLLPAVVLSSVGGLWADVVITEGEDWRRASSTVPSTIVPGSVLDLTDVLDDSSFEPLTIRDGHFVGVTSGRRARLFSDCEVLFRRVRGFNKREAEFDTPERIDAFCKELKRRGFNMVRFNALAASLMRDSKTDFKPLDREIDTFCRVVEAFNRNHIYMNVDVAATAVAWYAGRAWAKPLPPEQKVIGKRNIYVSEEARQAWLRGCRFLFDIQNPYTGRKFRDEPCLAMAIAYNEQEFGFSRAGEGFDDCTQIYRDWLRREYGDIAHLNESRSTQYASFDEVPVFTVAEKDRQPLRGVGLDVARFMDDAQVSLTEKYMRWFHEACPRHFVSNWNMAKDLRQMTLRKYCDFVTVNGYHAHPFDPAHHARRNRGVRIPPHVVKCLEGWSTIGKSAGLARAFATCRLQGKPFVVTEYSIGWWCRRRYEQGFVMGAYAALQGWDGISPFCENAAISSKPFPLKNFENWRDPVLQAENFLTALAFRRGDVRESDLKIRWTVNREELLKSPHSCKALSDAQSEFALVGSTALAVDEPAEAGSVSMKAVSGAEIIFREEGFQNAAVVDCDEAHRAFGRKIAARLRADGKLPQANATDPERGVFESSTGEILLDAPRAFMRVNTPRLQGVCAKGGTSEALSDVSIDEMTRDGNVFVAAREGLNPIRTANRLVVGYVTDVQNTGLTLADEEGCFLVKPGKLPALYETAHFTVAVRNDHAATLKAWAIAPNGARLAELPLEHQEGRVILTADTAKLSCGPVFFFELAER